MGDVVRLVERRPLEPGTSRAQRLHHDAMSLADMADAERRRGDTSQSRLLLLGASALEARAAEISTLEPTRSVLFRSAASLAYSAGDYHEALDLADEGLAGSPPSEIADELHDVRNAAKDALSCVKEPA